jgi:hypothetical protein
MKSVMRLAAFAIACALVPAVALAQHDVITPETSILPADHPAIQYNQPPADDPVARLNRQLKSGKTRLDYAPGGLGYLPSLLKNLGINPDSQTMVFSKTSFQATRISPRNPRAIFFSDEASVGSVRNGEVYEVAGLDPKRGVIFYTLDTRQVARPELDRRDVCLQCHMVQATLGVPGIMVASVHAESSGQPAFRLGEPVTDHRTKLEDRWGGWFITGSLGGQKHMGNAVIADTARPAVLTNGYAKDVTSLSYWFEPGGYLAQVSDVVALMTLEHQTRVTNLMTRVGWEARIAQKDGKLNDPAAKMRIEADIEYLVEYMLFADEAALQAPIQGVSTFSKTFPQRGPRDHAGRGLRDFDLQKRLFKYPLSYMIYAAAFDNLPDSARERIYQRLYDVLTGKDRSKSFAALSAEDRGNVLAILRDTKPGLPAYFKSP